MEAEAAAAAAASAALIFVNLEDDTLDSLEISAFRSCVLSKEAITMEYDGGSSYLLSSSAARGGVVAAVCIVTTDV